MQVFSYKTPVEIRYKAFIEKSQQIHGDKYDYSKVIYKNSGTKVTIVCPIHGEFNKTPDKHANSNEGCQKCGKLRRVSQDALFKTLQDVVTECNQIHNNLYTYVSIDETTLLHGVAITTNTKLNIKCFKCDCLFTTTINKHIYQQTGCPKCKRIEGGLPRRKTTTQFTKEAKQIHGDTFDYSLVDYVLAHTHVDIICKVHGIFKQIPADHILKTAGCSKCSAIESGLSRRKTIAQFIKEANQIHGNTFDYSLVSYNGLHTPVDIICKTHGVFKQSPANHTFNSSGCPKCVRSGPEDIIAAHLTDMAVIFTEQHKFVDCIAPASGRKLMFDFYLPDFNILIEFDGAHHYMPISYGGRDGTAALIHQQNLDEIKTQYAKLNNIMLIRIPYWSIKSTKDIISKLVR